MNSVEIQALRNSPVKPVNNIGSHFLTTAKYPLLYQQITKCGCTYVRSLLWYLEHGEVPAGKFGQFETDKSEVKAEHLSDDDVHQAPVKFVVIRHPVQRFMSLYFDKIVGTQDGEPTGVGRRIVRQADIDLDAGQDLDRHRGNCDRALDFIANEVRTKRFGEINWHWKPQLFRMSQLRPYGFTTLHLEGLDWQLPQVLGDMIPDIKDVMQVVSQRNTSAKPVTADDILTRALRLKIRDIYPTDYRMWQEVRNFWADKQPKG